MRNLCLLLILVNLGFAAWHGWFAEPPLPERPRVPGGPTIGVVGESVPRQGAGTAEEISADGSIDAAVAANEQQNIQVDCVSMGPLPDRVEVESAETMLANAGFNARRRTAPGEVWLGYWVYLDAIATQAEASSIVADLNASGIREAYVIADGDNGNLVSLGVFSIEERADFRVEQARELGFEPTVADRFQPGDVFWLDVTAEDGGRFALSAVPVANSEPSPQLIICEADAL